MFKKLFGISRLWKKILGVVFIVGACSFLFSGTASMVSEAHATGENATLSVDKTEVVGLIDLTLKIIYIILRPLLVIAGMSLDNSLVYGSFLHMDAPLRAFWNIIKNFANFALGFLVLFAIVKNIFAFGKADDKWKPQKIITQTLIAGVLIQISWFVMAALIDLSTVATYAVGALPLNVISSTDLGKHKIMNAHVEMDLNKFQKVISDKNDYFNVWYSVPFKVGNNTIPLNFSECKEEKGYIVGRKNGGTGFKNEITAFGSAEWGWKNACVKGGQLVFFNEFPPLRDSSVANNNDYQGVLQLILGLDSNWDAWNECRYIIKVSGKQADGLDGKCADDKEKLLNSVAPMYDGSDPSGDFPRDEKMMKIIDGLKGLPASINDDDVGLKYGDTRLQNNPDALSLDAIVDKSKGFVGPLITMYSSMLDFAQLASTSNDSSFGEIGAEMLIKTGFAVGLFFPLVALAIVLIIRIGFLWAVIVGAPFIVLIKAFGWEEKLGSLKDHFNLANIIQVIFAPVVTVFALSISLVFMSALMASIKTGGATGLGMTPVATTEAGTQMFSFFKDCLELKLDGFDGLGGALDVFSWFLINMIGIGLMRGIVFAAIKLNSIGKKIGGTVQNFGASFFQTLPILPVPGGEPVGIGSFGKIMGNIPQQKADAWNRAGEAKVEKWINPPETSALTSKQTTDIFNKITAEGKTASAAMAEVANIAEGKESEVMTASIPTVYAEVVKLEKIDKDRAKTIEDAFAADPSYGANRRGKYDVDKAIGTAKTFDEADKAVKAITYDPLSQLTALATAGTYEKEYADPKDANQTITYVFSKNTNNNGYIFTPKVK